MKNVFNIDKEELKAKREERKLKRQEKREERKANRKPGNVGKTLGIIGSYVAVAATAVVTTLAVYTHMHSGGVDLMVDSTAVNDAPVEMEGAEV